MPEIAPRSIGPSPTVPTKARRLWWIALPVGLAAVLAIALGVRTAHRARAVSTEPTTNDPLLTGTPIGARERTCGGHALRKHQRKPRGRLPGAGPAGDDPRSPVRISRASVIARNSSFTPPHRRHRFTRDRPAPQLRVPDKWQRTARSRQVAGGRTTRRCGSWDARCGPRSFRPEPAVTSSAVEDEISDQVADALAGDRRPASLRRCTASAAATSRPTWPSCTAARCSAGSAERSRTPRVPYFEKASDPGPAFRCGLCLPVRRAPAGGGKRHEDLTSAGSVTVR